MIITSTMDLGQLAERMGDQADRSDAENMRDILIANDYEGMDTIDIPEADWLEMLNLAAHA